MHNFAELITPEEAFEQYKEVNNGISPFTIHELHQMASDRSKCQCGEPVWRSAGQGLCFTCTTGESDASDDYELIYTPMKKKSITKRSK